MKDFQVIAQNYIENNCGDDLQVIPLKFNELDEDFFCFTYNKKDYVSTGDKSLMMIGIGFHFLYKKDERIFSFASCYTYEEALNELKDKIFIESKIRETIKHFTIGESYSLKISKLINKEILLGILKKYRFKYIIPEIIGSSIYRIEKLYTSKLLEKRLMELPVEFKGINQESIVYICNDLLENKCCVFTLLELSTCTYASNLSSATENDFTPIW